MTERERFEEWAKVSYLILERMSDGSYYNDSVNEAWIGWQAALASREEE